MEAIGLQTQIWNNNLRSAVLLAGFPVLLIGMVFALQLALMGAGVFPSTHSLDGDLASAVGMLAVSAPLAIGVAVIWFTIAYFGSQTIIDLTTGAQKVERTDQPRLYNLLENLAISRGLKPPAVRVISSPALNAYATGLNQSQYTITVTQGLLDALTDQELEAVLAHELSHILNRDVRTMVIAAVFAGIITLIAQIIYRGMRFSSFSRRSSKSAGVFILIALAVAAIGYLLAIVIKFAISRQREYVADSGSAQLTKNPDALISALRKVSQGPRLEAPEQVRAMFLDDHKPGFSLFASHPPIERRIAALVKFAGGHDLPEATPAPLQQPGDETPAGPWG